MVKYTMYTINPLNCVQMFNTMRLKSCNVEIKEMVVPEEILLLGKQDKGIVTQF